MFVNVPWTSGSGGITATSTDTFENKSISGSDNTFSNIPQSAVTNLNTALNARQNNLTSSSNIEVGHLTANNKMFLIVGDVDNSNDGNTNDHQFKITNALVADDSNALDLKIFANKANTYGAIQVTQNNVGGKPQISQNFFYFFDQSQSEKIVRKMRIEFRYASE